MSRYEWDVFIAHASEDSATAREIYDRLKQRCRVFLATECVPPGALWQKHIPEVMNRSRVFVILVSSATQTASYQLEEIHRAVDLHSEAKRDPSLRPRSILPIFLEPAETPYGLHIVQRLDARSLGGVDGIAAIVSGALDQLRVAAPAPAQREDPGSLDVARFSSKPFEGRGESRPAPPMSARALTDDARSPAVELDRLKQWYPVLHECREHLNQNLFFLLYGHTKQSLKFFLDRIHYDLKRHCVVPHRVHTVPFKLQGTSAKTAAEWEAHVAFALDKSGGNAAQLLHKATQHEALLLILGRQPLGFLTGGEEEGLEDFICRRLPDLLREAKPANPVRVLIAIEYEAEEQSIHERVHDWARKAEKTGALRYHRLRPVTFPTWDEVLIYIESAPSRPSEETIAAIEMVYRKIEPEKSFHLLAERLNRYLGDI